MAEGWVEAVKAGAPDDLTIKEMVRGMQAELDNKVRRRRAATGQNITVSCGASHLLAYTLIVVSHRYVLATMSEKWLVSLYELSSHITLMDEPGHQPRLTEPHPPALMSLGVCCAPHSFLNHCNIPNITLTHVPVSICALLSNLLGLNHPT
jgi:hypothetical protein